jgi:hypothetical protein
MESPEPAAEPGLRPPGAGPPDPGRGSRLTGLNPQRKIGIEEGARQKPGAPGPRSRDGTAGRLTITKADSSTHPVPGHERSARASDCRRPRPAGRHGAAQAGSKTPPSCASAQTSARARWRRHRRPGRTPQQLFGLTCRTADLLRVTKALLAQPTCPDFTRMLFRRPSQGRILPLGMPLKRRLAAALTSPRDALHDNQMPMTDWFGWPNSSPLGAGSAPETVLAHRAGPRLR